MKQSRVLDYMKIKNNFEICTTEENIKDQKKRLKKLMEDQNRSKDYKDALKEGKIQFYISSKKKNDGLIYTLVKIHVSFTAGFSKARISQSDLIDSEILSIRTTPDTLESIVDNRYDRLQLISDFELPEEESLIRDNYEEIKYKDKYYVVKGKVTLKYFMVTLQ